MFLVLFDFEFQLQKMVENWHAARIRSSLEILLSDTKLQTHGNVNDSASSFLIFFYRLVTCTVTISTPH